MKTIFLFVSFVIPIMGLAQQQYFIWDGSHIAPLPNPQSIVCDHWAIWVFGDGVQAIPGKQWGEVDGKTPDEAQKKWEANVKFEKQWKKFAHIQSDPTGYENHIGPIAILKQASSQHLKGNEAGLKLLLEAQTHQGQPYAPDMTCSELIKKSGERSGSPPSLPPITTDMRPTTYWFEKGMGPYYKQIYGGVDGVNLAQLAADVGNSTLNIPIGSVIVAPGVNGGEGHAALYDGVVKVGSIWRIVLFDSNGFSGYKWCIDGGPSAEACRIVQLFPGRQVGENLSGLQWGSNHKVKVFQPIGNVR